MSNMIRVIATKDVPRDCSTCLYGRTGGCANADRRKDWLRYALFRGCPSYWLDHNRFERAR